MSKKGKLWQLCKVCLTTICVWIKPKLVEQLEASQTNKGYLDLEYARQKELSDENVNAKKTFQKVASDLEFENKKIANLQNQIAILGQNLEIGGASQSPILAVTAPISGYISEVYIKIGSNAEVGKPLFSIVDNSANARRFIGL